MPSTTVGALAAGHGVSPRTIQRDIADLHAMGIPVWTRTGPAGGVGMVQGWSSPVSGMTSAEIQALLIGEAGSSGLGLLAEFRVARAKVSSTAEPAARAADSVGQKFLIDSTQWFSAAEQPGELADLSQALWTGRRITIRYRPYRRDPVSRLLDPLGLVLKTDLWYLVAAHRNQPRTYRVSRIEKVRIHDDEARRPAGFSLPDYWEAARHEFDSSIRTTSVVLSLPAERLGDLRRAVPGPATDSAIAAGTVTAGRLLLHLPMEGSEIAASQLVTVIGIEVHGPPELRAELRARGRELAARNDGQ